MAEIEETVRNLESLYQTLTGRTPPPVDPEAPYAPIPPERNPEQHVSDQIDRLMNMLSGTKREPVLRWMPPVAVWEAPDNLMIRVDLPGVPREAVHVTLQQNLLTIEGTRAENIERTPAGEYRLRQSECPMGRFHRRLMLPPGMIADRLSAQMKEGVLEIHVPREVPSAAGRTVPVQ